MNVSAEDLRDLIVTDGDERTRAAAWELYLRATNAERALLEYREHRDRRDLAAYRALVRLGRLVMATPAGRKTVPFDAVRDIWRDGCHG